MKTARADPVGNPHGLSRTDFDSRDVTPSARIADFAAVACMNGWRARASIEYTSKKTLMCSHLLELPRIVHSISQKMYSKAGGQHNQILQLKFLSCLVVCVFLCVGAFVSSFSTQKQHAEEEKARKKKEEAEKKRIAAGVWERFYTHDGDKYWQHSVTGKKVDRDPYY